MTRIPAAAYAARRRRIFEQLPAGAALLLPTAPERQRNSDVHYPFRPDSDFYYVTGFTEPGAWALLKKGGEGEHYTLFVLPRDKDRETWTGRRHGIAGAVERFGADEAFSVKDLDKQLRMLLADVENLYFAFGRHPEVEATLSAVLNKLRNPRKAHQGPTALVDPGPLLHELRLRKDEDELAMMREGARITAEAHRLAMEQARPGMKEYEIQALIEYTFRRHGAWGYAYPSIVGGGENACILHYIENSGTFGSSDLMLIDAGAEVDSYATDVTRTSPVCGRYSPAQRDVYEAVLGCQIKAIELCKPGATLLGIHEDCVRMLCASCIELGLLKGSVDENIESGAIKRFYMHRSSHWLGMDVHDVGRYELSTGSDRPLEPGMVLTVEPGLYISPNDEQVPRALRGIGVRIEDDILITADGNENLTAAVPKSVEQIEGLRS